LRWFTLGQASGTSFAATGISCHPLAGIEVFHTDCGWCVRRRCHNTL